MEIGRVVAHQHGRVGGGAQAGEQAVHGAHGPARGAGRFAEEQQVAPHVAVVEAQPQVVFPAKLEQVIRLGTLEQRRAVVGTHGGEAQGQLAAGADVSKMAAAHSFGQAVAASQLGGRAVQAGVEQARAELVVCGQRILGLAQVGVHVAVRGEARGLPARGQLVGGRATPEKRVFEQPRVGPHAHRRAPHGGNHLRALAHGKARRKQQTLPKLHLVVAQGQRFPAPALLQHEVRREVVEPHPALPWLPGPGLAGVFFQRETHAEVLAVAGAVAQRHLVGGPKVAQRGAALVERGRGIALAGLQHPLVPHQQVGVVFVQNALPQGPPGSAGVGPRYCHKRQEPADGPQVKSFDALQLVHTQQQVIGLAVVQEVGNLDFRKQQQGP